MLNKSDVTLLSDAFLMLYLFFSVLFSQFCFVFILFLRTCVVATFTSRPTVGGVVCSPKVCWSRISTYMKKIKIK